ncbi:MAG: PAS domain S-box protein [Chthoniobacter sp.]|uniref:PAS domain S-box protein n=1 Tax=Chthoniobacter sp. TaxID=2510640 RepID=UPI0032A3CEA2
MTKPFPFLSSWQEWCGALSGALVATWGLLALIPKIFRETKKFYDGVVFLLEIRDQLTEIRLTISNIDDGQLNIIESLWHGRDTDENTVWFQTDGKGQTQRISKTWTAWTGLPVDAARGRGWENAIAPEDQARAIQGWQLAIDHQRAYQDSFHYIDTLGRRILVIVAAAPIRQHDGTILNYFGSARKAGAANTGSQVPK